MICTFYSYKGGVGRSMALANVADRLCRQRLKTLIIDFDLEAPGLERFFPIETQAARQNQGLLDLLVAYKLAMSQPVGRGTRDFQKLERYIFPIYFELPGGGSLHLLPAGMRADEAQLSNYAYQLRTFDWQEFYFDWGGELFFQWLTLEIGKRYDVALVDSRTGVTEMGGVCAYQLADVLVMLCAPNAQNLLGTREVLRNFNSERVRALRKNRALNVLVAPARVQQDSPELDKFRSAFAVFEDSAPVLLKAMGLSFWDLMMPYDPAFAFEERLASDQSPNLNGALRHAYDRLATIVASMGPEGSKAAEAGKRMASAAGGAPGAPAGPMPQIELEYDPTTSIAGYDVFMSYSRADRDFASRLVALLMNAGFRTFFDQEQLHPSEPWREAIQSALTQSATVLILVGEQTSSWQFDEIAAALQTQRRIMPVLLSGSSFERLPKVLQAFQCLDLRAGITAETTAVLLEFAKGPVRKSSRIATAEENPYVGLRSFRESDARFFFGRDALVAQALERLRSSPFLAIVGASGSGKSTLLRAGIIPRLREQAELRLTFVRPGLNPVREIAQALAQIEGVTAAQMEKALREGASVALKVMPPGCLIIVVDQLEEFWRLPDRHERLVYLRLLRSIVRDNPENLKLIAVLRADFYGQITEDPEFSDMISRNQLLVGRMSRDELRQAIEQPAQANGVSFEPGLVERILDDLEQSTSPLPMLQILLERLWEDRRRGFITHESYERCGGLRILAFTAEDAFNSLPEEGRHIARSLFLKLVSPQGIRIPVPIQDLTEVERVVMDRFVQSRVLRTSANEKSSYVELAYEPLVREWNRLKSWIDEQRATLDYRTRLQSDVAAWKKEGRVSRLYGGPELAEAKEWLLHHNELASAEQVKFILASEKASARATRLRLVTSTSVLLILALVVGILAYLDVQSRRLGKLKRLYEGATIELNGEFGTQSLAKSPIQQFNRERVLNGVRGRRKDAVQLAFELYDQHTPFKWGGKTPSDGLDTSGFVAYILSRVGILDRPERYWSGLLRQSFEANQVTNISQIMPGDLIFEEDKACWFKLTEEYAIGIEIAEPATFGSRVVGYGKVPYERFSSESR
jgi:cellulose biosynthesis protein BcsQ/energy-coupling factor transporter ATP-binding protein EcfA2